MRHDDELRAVREAPQQRQEAVDVLVVERGLDLVEDVERARPGEETANRNASAVIDFSPPESSVRRFVALPAGVISISTPMPSSSRPPPRPRLPPRPPRSAPRPAARASRRRRRARGAARRRGARAAAAPAAGEQLLGDLLEVLRRSRERLLERVADALVGVADQALELAHRRLQVLALALELLDVLDRLRVLLLGERVDGPAARCGAAAARSALQVGALGWSGSGSAAGSGSRPSLPAEPLQLRARVACPSRACWARTSPRVTSSPCAFSRAWTWTSSLRERAQLAREPLAGVAVGDELGVEHLDARLHRALGGLQRGDEPRGGRLQRSASS